MKSVKTSKGTDLPFTNLKGKDYLDVKYRVVWFREDKPDWSIETEFLELTNDYAVAKATIKDPTGRVIATSHKHEDKKGFVDFREKAETGAVGRALALLGYGTANAQDLDEGEQDGKRDVVDSPVTAKGAPKAVTPDLVDPREETIEIGKNPKRKFKDMSNRELQSILDWIESNNVRTPKANRFVELYNQLLRAELDQDVRLPS
ncbi:MAG: hypothetical protein H0X02_13055 [Nitrosomonas sp.]|nr:hypothetical protein [Nitrosomonas sp.]